MATKTPKTAMAKEKKKPKKTEPLIANNRTYCPKCKKDDYEVEDSSLIETGTFQFTCICERCNLIFKTIEKLVDGKFKVI